LVLVILAVIWAAVLLPPFLQHRSENRPADSISTFRSQLSVLERRSVGVSGGGSTSSAPSNALRPVSPSATFSGVPRGTVDRGRLARLEAKKRRRDILVTLLAAAGITLVLTVLMPPVLFLHLAIDALLVGYVALLVRHKKLAEERAMKVRAMAPARARRAAATAPARPQRPAQVALRPAAVN
jgi:hypothetical protein